MKTKNVILTLMAFALVVAMAPSAEAVCIPGKAFGTWDAPNYNYVFGWNQDHALTVGVFWQAGARADANEGTYDEADWLRYYAGYGTYISGQISAGTVGCVTGEMILAITQDNGDGTASFAVNQETEKTTGLNFWQANMTLVPMPRPRVTNSSRSGAQVVVDVAFDGVDSAFTSQTGSTAAGTFTNFVLLSAHGPADPGRDGAAWTEVGRVAYNGAGASITGLAVDCADDGGDTFLAFGLEIDNELIPSLHVSASTALECDPTLANPDDKFDMIRERGKGQKKGRPFTDR